MTTPYLVGVVEMVERVLADRLEQREPLVAAADDPRLDERGQRLDRILPVDRLDVGEARSRPRTPRAGEQRLRVGVEEREAPVERRAQRLLARRQVARAADEHVERLVEPLLERRHRQRAHARRGELDRERQPVEAARRSARRAAVSSSSSNAGSTARARAAKSATASASGSGGTEYSCSPPRRSGTRDVASTRRRGAFASRRASSGAASAASCSRLSSTSSTRRRREPRLDLVRVARHRAPAPIVGTISSASRIARQVDERRAAAHLGREVLGDREREPRLARAAGAGERDEPHVVAAEDRLDRGHLEPAADERRRRRRQPQPRRLRRAPRARAPDRG